MLILTAHTRACSGFLARAVRMRMRIGTTTPITTAAIICLSASFQSLAGIGSHKAIGKLLFEVVTQCGLPRGLVETKSLAITSRSEVMGLRGELQALEEMAWSEKQPPTPFHYPEGIGGGDLWFSFNAINSPQAFKDVKKIL